MRVVFLGVGEACDERHANTSVLVTTKTDLDEASALLDCGFTAPPRYWESEPDPEKLNVLWISHYHGDHFFGTPALLLRFWEMKRRKPLRVMGPPGVREKVLGALDLAYPGFEARLPFELDFLPVEPGREVDAAGLRWRFALSGHPRSNLAVRVDDGRNSVFYSGDGPPTEETLALARGCGLIVHEAFGFRETPPGHCSVEEAVRFARDAGARILALVHMRRDERQNLHGEILRHIASIHLPHVILPEPGDALAL